MGGLSLSSLGSTIGIHPSFYIKRNLAIAHITEIVHAGSFWDARFSAEVDGEVRGLCWQMGFAKICAIKLVVVMPKLKRE